VEALEARRLLSTALVVTPNVDVSQKAANQVEGTIAVNRSNPNNVVAFSVDMAVNNGQGMFEGISNTGGMTWTTRRDIATGPGGDGIPASSADVQAAFDTFGDLFVTYQTAANTIELLVSTDGGVTFPAALRQNFNPVAGATDTDQPSVATGPGTAANTASVWLTWIQGNQTWASGAQVTARGVIGAFTAPQSLPGLAGTATGGTATTLVDAAQTFNNQFIGLRVAINTGAGAGQSSTISAVDAGGHTLTVTPAFGAGAGAGPRAGSTYQITGGNFGNISIGPGGGVIDIYQLPTAGPGPSAIYENVNMTGAAGGFGPERMVVTTQVGGLRVIPAQNTNFAFYPPAAFPTPPSGVLGIPAEANAAWDSSGLAHNNRIYIAYTDATSATSNDTNIFLIASDDNGISWNALGGHVRVNDDMGTNSQFLPSIAIDQTTGNVDVSWYDARNSGAANNTAQFFTAVTINGGQSFLPNVQVSKGTSQASTSEPPPNLQSGTATGGTRTTLTDAAVVFANQVIGLPVFINTGAGAGQFDTITAVGGAGHTLTVTAFGAGAGAGPRAGSTYTISRGYRGLDFGDYSYVDFYRNIVYPLWADNSAALTANPDRPRLDLATAQVRLMPTPDVLTPPAPAFEGLRRGQAAVGNSEPPDPQIATGPLQILETVNTGLAIYNKNTGAAISTQTLANFFAALKPATLFDPVLTFDESIGNGVGNAPGRFIVAAADVDAVKQKSFLDIAVSNDDDATHGFTEMHRIDISQSILFGLINLWGSYTRIGWNADAVVLTVNMNQFPFNEGDGGLYDHVQIVVIDASTLADANNATFTARRFDSTGFPPFLGLGNFSLVPAVMHGTAPGGPMGGPMWFVEEGSFVPLLQTTIRLIKVSNILAQTLTYTSTDVPVTSYRNLLPKNQPGGTFDASADTRITSVAVRGNRLVAAQTVGTGTILNRGPDHARWYDFNIGGATPALAQSGDIDRGPGVDTYYPSIEIAANGDLGMTFMESSATEAISMYITGRRDGNPLNTMQFPVLIRAGQGRYTGSRAGDYSGIAIDPKGNTFWAVNEYNTAANNNIWGTAIAAFRVQPPIPTAIRDNLDWGYRDVGTNWSSFNSGFRGNSRFDAPAVAGTDYARWYFLVVPGQFEVYVTWQVFHNSLGAGNNSKAAVYKILGGGPLLATVQIDQSKTPSSVIVNGTPWQYLGSYRVTGVLLTVELDQAADGPVIADAVFLVDPPPPAAANVAALMLPSRGTMGVDGNEQPDAAKSSIPVRSAPIGMPAGPAIGLLSPSLPQRIAPSAAAVDGLLALADQEDFWGTPIVSSKSKRTRVALPWAT
jgi:hypothetical protein